MNRTFFLLLSAAVAMGATAARADDFHPREGRFGGARPEAGRPGWGLQPGWREHEWREHEWREHEWREHQRRGHRELRRVERWVSGGVQPRWVPGSCFTDAWGQYRCAAGSWIQVPLPPRLEVSHEWVWVPGRW